MIFNYTLDFPFSKLVKTTPVECKHLKRNIKDKNKGIQYFNRNLNWKITNKVCKGILHYTVYGMVNNATKQQTYNTDNRRLWADFSKNINLVYSTYIESVSRIFIILLLIKIK